MCGLFQHHQCFPVIFHVAENKQGALEVWVLMHQKRKQNLLSLRSQGSLTVFCRPFHSDPPPFSGKVRSSPWSPPQGCQDTVHYYSEIKEGNLTRRHSTSWLPGEISLRSFHSLRHFYCCFLFLFWCSLSGRCAVVITQNQSGGNPCSLLDVFAAFWLPQLPPSPGKTGQLWTFCRLKKITVLPPARNRNVATLTPPLMKKRVNKCTCWASPRAAGLVEPKPRFPDARLLGWASRPRPRPPAPRPLPFQSNSLLSVFLDFTGCSCNSFTYDGSPRPFAGSAHGLILQTDFAPQQK